MFASSLEGTPGCFKDLICSRGLVAVSKWPVETLTGAGSVINGESNLTSRQKVLSQVSCFHLLSFSLCSITTCRICHFSVHSCDSCSHYYTWGLFIQLNWLLADLVLIQRWLIGEMLTYSMVNRSGCTNHFTVMYPWNADIVCLVWKTRYNWDRHKHRQTRT